MRKLGVGRSAMWSVATALVTASLTLGAISVAAPAQAAEDSVEVLATQPSVTATSDAPTALPMPQSMPLTPTPKSDGSGATASTSAASNIAPESSANIATSAEQPEILLTKQPRIPLADPSGTSSAIIKPATLAQYYVSKDGNDTNGDGSRSNPWATFAKTAQIINAQPSGGEYEVIVLSDMTITACARYFSAGVTISSEGVVPFTVTRGAGFAGQADNARSWYNPAMFEIGNQGSNFGVLPVTLSFRNIILDDAGLHEGTRFVGQTTGGVSDNTEVVQDAIVASYDSAATIELAQGAILRNVGGMAAIHAAPAKVVMRAGSVIEDTTVTTRPDYSWGSGRWASAGTAMIQVFNGSVRMEAGSSIRNIVDLGGIHASGDLKMYMDGNISGLRGVRNLDIADSGRGSKNAISLQNCTTYNPSTGMRGAAIIGPNGTVIDNQTKSGAIQVRGSEAALRIYGKVNDNLGLSGIQTILIFEIPSGTNGGGLYLIGGATVYLEDGSELRNNRVQDGGIGGAASVQQGNSKLIMNGGLISGNSASEIPDVAVHRDNASFIMNGGKIESTDPNSVELRANSPQTNGNLILNAGEVSHVVVGAEVLPGNIAQRHLVLKPSVKITSGYVRVAGRRLTPTLTIGQSELLLGNPNTANYAAIRSGLPAEWSMPTSDNNVVGFWMQQNDTASFTLPKPATSGADSMYHADPDVYYAAVAEVDADGVAVAGVPVSVYPATLVNEQLKVLVPLGAYPNGVTFALVQPPAGTVASPSPTPTDPSPTPIAPLPSPTDPSPNDPLPTASVLPTTLLSPFPLASASVSASPKATLPTATTTSTATPRSIVTASGGSGSYSLPPKTGDESNQGQWVFIGISCLAAITVLMILKLLAARRRQQ